MSGAAHPETSTQPVPGPLSAGLRTVTLAIVALVSLIAFEALAVSTAMPVTAAELGGLRGYGLAFSLFLTTSMLGMVVAGSWTDARGPRAPVVVGLVLFAGGLVVAGAAPSFPVLLVGRAVSGLGGGLLGVSLYVVVAAVYATELRPKVFGLISAAWVVPSMLGPMVAGWLAENLSWRWVYLGVAPLVLVVAAALLPRVWSMVGGTPGTEDVPPGGRRRAAGARRALAGLGLATGAAALQWGAQQLQSPTVASVTAVVLGALAVAGCLPPLLPAGTLTAARGLPSVIAVRGLLAACFFGAETFVPLMLVNERGLSATVAGFTLTGGAVGWAAGSWLQGNRLTVPRHRLLVAGGLLVATVAALLPLATLQAVPPLAVLPVWTAAGLGMGMALSTTSVLVLSLSPPGLEGRNSSSLQVSDALGSVVGIGAAGAVFATLHTRPGDDGHVFALIWGTLALAGLAAAAVGRRARPRDGGAPGAGAPGAGLPGAGASGAGAHAAPTGA